MNGYERTLAALQGRPRDRVPVMLHNFMMAAHERGVSMGRYRNDPRLIADCFLRTIETYDVDGVLVDIDTCTLAGAVGVPIDLPEHEPARCSGGLLASLEAVDDLPAVDLAADRRVQIWLEAVSLLAEQVGGEIFIRGNCDQCPFALASMIRTPGLWMMDLMDEARADHAVRLLEYCTEVTGRFLDLMARAGADALSNGDSPAGPAMISPEMYRRWAVPYEKRIADRARRLGKPYVLHICGDTSLILSDMLDLGTDALELDYKTDMQKAHDLMATRCTFLGNLDPSGVLALGTVERVERETRRLVELFSDTPRFILNAGCAIPPETPPENIRAMIRISRT